MPALLAGSRLGAGGAEGAPVSAVPSPFAPHRRSRPRIGRGSISHREQWGTWEVLIIVEGRRKYIGAFTSLELATVAREHVYQERLAGRPIPTYFMSTEERSRRRQIAGVERWRRKRAEDAAKPSPPPPPPRERVAVPRIGAKVARCRCGLALPCESCIPTARDFAESRRDTD